MILEAKSKPSRKQRDKLRKAVSECMASFDDPSKWPHLPEFGMLAEGHAVPDRVNSVLRDFHPDGTELSEVLDARGRRQDFYRGLAELVEARHTAAHALPNRENPSPRDCQAWLVASFWLVRAIESYMDDTF